MNTLDIVLLLLFIPGIIRGLTKGFLEQIISLGGIVLSVYLSFKFSNLACDYIQQYITVSETVLHVLGFAVVLLGSLILVILCAKLVTKVAEMASLGWINKVLGMVFSLCTTALLLGILIILFDTVNLKFELVQGPVLEESVLYGHLKDFGYFIFPYMKQLLMKTS